MKKLNSKGFILAETLVVSVFLMVLFTMIYSNFYPIIGIYEERENYDDVDGKYTAFWIKKLIESDAYDLSKLSDERSKALINSMNQNGYIRFECKDVQPYDNQNEICKSLVTALDIANCDRDGNNCDIFITRYQIGNMTGEVSNRPSFKETVQNNDIFRYEESCLTPDDPKKCKETMLTDCCEKKGLSGCFVPESFMLSTDPETIYTGDKSAENTKIAKECQKRTLSRVFTSAEKDYILSLPNYTKRHDTTQAKYRVIVVTHNEKDQNNYYGFSTIEVIK